MKVTCTHCQQPTLEIIVQGTKPAIVDGEMKFTSSIELATCWNEQCDGCGVTVTRHKHATMDFSPYKVKRA